MLFLSYVLPILIIFLGFKWPKSIFVSILIGLYIWAIMGLNLGMETPDYSNYELRYNEILLSFSWGLFDTEWGYNGLNFLFNLLGFSYQEFRMIYAALFTIIAIGAAKRLCSFPNYVLSLFLIWPFFASVSAQRQTMASIIVCWAMPFLVSNKRIDTIKFVITLLFAASIHNSVLFYFLCIFFRNPLTTFRIRLIILIALFLTILFYFGFMLRGVGENVDNYKVGKYLDRSADGVDHMSFITFVLYISLLFITIFAVRKLSNILIKTNNNIKNNTIFVDKIVLYNNVFIMVILTIPGYVVSGIYHRLLIGILPIGYAVFAEFYFSQHIVTRNRRKYILYYFTVIILLMMSYIVVNFDTHKVYAVLYDNMLFK